MNDKKVNSVFQFRWAFSCLSVKYKYARRIVQLLVGLYMLIYLGLICNENMQIEGFWYYLFTGVFKRQQSITLLQKYSVLCSLEEAGADMPVGQRW